jgi:hypothetical protein
MSTLIRLAALPAWIAALSFALPVAADYEGASGYGSSDTTTDELDVSHSGYPSAGQTPGSKAADAATAPNYVVIEVEDGVSQQVDGETVIVVQEPEPVAASDQAPPPPREVPIAQPTARCPAGAIWVDGYWTYGDGQYVWVEGHCVVERVNYVFVHPRWDFYANVWWFVPGYYRPCSVWVGFGYYRPWYWFPPYHHAYYRGYRGVPVYRSVPRRPTVARPVARHPVRTGTVGRAPTRTSTVARPSTAGRLPTVTRTLPTRTGAVVRSTPTSTRVATARRPGPATARTGVVDRPPAATRAPAVSRAPSPSRAPTVSRPPAASRAPTVGRAGSGPSRTSSVRRPGLGSSRSGTVSRPNKSPSRSSSVRSSGWGGSRSGGWGRSGMGSSRPSFGRTGGFGRPSSGGFGGARSVPTARGR